MRAAMKRKADDEFKEFLGEPLNEFTISEEGISEYEKLTKIITNVNKNILYGSYEAEYRRQLAKELIASGYKVKEEVTYHQYTSENSSRPRADLEICNENGECVVELKLGRRRQDFLQLAEYILVSGLPVGYLVIFYKNRIELYTLLHMNEKLYCYFKGHLYLLPLELLTHREETSHNAPQPS
jgi:GxxExxY protein